MRTSAEGRQPESGRQSARRALERTRQLEKGFAKQLKDGPQRRRSANLSSKAVDLNGVKLFGQRALLVLNEMLRTMVDDLKNQLGSTVIVLATVVEGKVSTPDCGRAKDVTDR